MTVLPLDYAERVYAGVLGKMIGVYLGRPFEGWTHERIMQELGEITYYVHDKFKRPLIVTDDDLSGTFGFLRAMSDYGNNPDLTPAQIGQTWLNYLVEERATLWWGGFGNSTEHTAYLRLKNGITAPASGSAATNGKIVSEQIGAQIFIDGWAMLAPGDPERAADYARRAASVSHDGEAIYGAQVIAAMEALAFVESDINTLIDGAVRLIPRDSLVYRLIMDVRGWHAADSADDWKQTRSLIAAHYGYDKYTGVCHIVPNHALIILSLLYGGGEFQKSLLIANTSGWDTDCNSGNVGCLLGIRGGLATFEQDGVDWRTPVADRLYISTAEGGRTITDAVTEAYQIINMGRALHGESPLQPKNGARFHFEQAGAVQGFRADEGASIRNVAGHSGSGSRSLCIDYHSAGNVARIFTPTFAPPDVGALPPYALIAAPSLYAGQMIRAEVQADETNNGALEVRLQAQIYGATDHLSPLAGAEQTIQPGQRITLEWQIEDTCGAPIAEIGLEVKGNQAGRLYLDYLTWQGSPQVTLTRPDHGGLQWHRAWANAIDHFEPTWGEAFRLAHDSGRGMIIQGSREWQDYEMQSVITPHFASSVGIAARVQGLERYYALLLVNPDMIRLVKMLDGETVLAEEPFEWREEASYALKLRLNGSHLQAFIDSKLVFDIHDNEPLCGGGVAFVCELGSLSSNAISVQPTKESEQQ
ncbi:MAG: ADP-ribosylglycohydrolase family protein [Anaerolineae bacterium]|nr:ADP-ribosylglycohydrolase family protein [Anaerolineae bacterium]